MTVSVFAGSITAFAESGTVFTFSLDAEDDHYATETIPPDSIPPDDRIEQSAKTPCPPTGYEASLIIWWIILIVSLCIIPVILYISRSDNFQK